MDGLFFVRIVLPMDQDAGEDNAADSVVMNQLFTRIHRAAKGTRFAISLPGLTDASEGINATLGITMQLFCASKQDLAKILDSTQVRRLLRDTCTVTPVRPVLPNMVEGWESYIRDRRSDKNSPSAMRRSQRRLDQGICQENRASATGAGTKTSNALPYFDHLSLTTACEGEDTRSIRIYVTKIKAVKPARFAFDSFGLSRLNSDKKSIHNGAVPVLRNLSRG